MLKKKKLLFPLCPFPRKDWRFREDLKKKKFIYRAIKNITFLSVKKTL
jgi:hypothetical protein